ncbi:MAG: deoxyadenosine kinase [candidate division Zixibacteria bacterium DG_27]|nr:MAG: deoxyadenosine kinase [candidate division Zixibacteria bacterium DG_27]
MDELSKSSDLNYIVVEGPIGVGKTYLAERLAERFSWRLLLEEAETNPFLKDFYRDRERYAFQTQLYFLVSRFRQQQEFFYRDLFTGGMVSDYAFAKDRIFATINLSEKELALYDRIQTALVEKPPLPDLIVYLTAEVKVLLERIKSRGRSFEREMEPEYLEKLSEAYSQFFFHYDRSPLLVVNTNNLDLVSNHEHLDDLIEQIRKPPLGKRYYNPSW